MSSEPPRPRRVIEPPVGVVRALPPHAIQATSVGPYKLGAKLSDLLEELPSGPRMVLFEVPGLLHRSLIRAEDKDAVLIGGDPQGTATFVAVVGAEVARTESGIHVGSTRAEVARALGPEVVELDRARDPRLLIPSGLRNARLVLDGDRVSAIAILDPSLAAVSVTPRDPAADAACPRPAPSDKASDKAFGACLTGAGELVEYTDSEITIRAPESEKTFKVPATIVFAAPLRATDGKDELVVIIRTDESQLRSWSLLAFRFENGKITKTIDPSPLYQVSSANARWIGAEVHDVDLYLELSGRGDAIEVGGLLTTRPGPDGGPTRDVVAISPVLVAHRRGKSAPPEGSAEPPDAGTGAREGSGSAGSERAKP